MSAPTSIDLTPELNAWAENVIHLFDLKVQQLDIHVGNLVNSFEKHVFWHSAGNWNKVMFVFEYYGKFVDMGVGRGVLLKDRDAMIHTGLTSRRPKLWVSDVIYKQLPSLRAIVADHIANGMLLVVARSYDQIEQLTLNV